MSASIYHITALKDWQVAQTAGAYTADSLASEGFIHCSTRAQVVAVANAHFCGKRDLVVLQISQNLLRAELRWEMGADRPNDCFPHIYGALNSEAVTRVLTLPTGEDGNFCLPDEMRGEMELVIRPAVLDDKKPVVELIRLSTGDELDWLFGQERGHTADQVVEALYLRKGNRLSHHQCVVAEMNGQVVGLLLAYPGTRLRRQDLRTGLQLVQIFGLGGTVRLARRQVEYGDLQEAEGDEFYISNLGVPPKYQGQGIGQALLDHCEGLARARGFKKLSLIVTLDNPARRLYERAGFQTVHTHVVNHPVIAHGSGGFYRMVRLLSSETKP